MRTQSIRSKIITALAGGVAVASLAATPALAQDVPTTDPTDPNPVSLGHFDVKVTMAGTADNLKHIEVSTCAKNLAPGEKVRVSWDPWSVENATGQTFDAGAYEGGSDQDDYPYGDGAANNGSHDNERFLGNGECATGSLAFAPEGFTTAIVYQNGYGEKAVWRLDS